MKTLSLFILLFVLNACSAGIDPYQWADRESTYEDFTLCHGYGCTHQMRLGLREHEWHDILKNFDKPAQSAEKERSQIAKSAAAFERYTHKISGLIEDQAEASRLPENEGQMDCIDETVNLSQFLSFLDEADVLKYHKATKPIHRGFFIDGKWPHNTATITEIKTGQVYAVDGYYRKGGEEPHIIEKEIWMANWRPNRPQ